MSGSMATEIETFITHPVPYALGEQRAEVREQTRSIALAHLLGALAELIEQGAVTTQSVTAAVSAALTAGREYQDAQTAHLLAVAS